MRPLSRASDNAARHRTHYKTARKTERSEDLIWQAAKRGLPVPEASARIWLLCDSAAVDYVDASRVKFPSLRDRMAETQKHRYSNTLKSVHPLSLVLLIFSMPSLSVDF